MIVIAEPYARYADTVPADGLQGAAANLLEFAERITRDHFHDRYDRFQMAVVTRVEIGSTRVRITISSLATILIFYGGIRQSVDYLVNDAKQLGSALLAEAPRVLGLPPAPPAAQALRLGIPGQLHRLFVRVERGEISPEDATARALSILQIQADEDVVRDLPELMRQLSSAFGDAAAGGEAPGASPPKLPVRRPVLGLPPTAPTPRRRGAVAGRDRKTGRVSVSEY